MSIIIETDKNLAVDDLIIGRYYMIEHDGERQPCEVVDYLGKGGKYLKLMNGAVIEPKRAKLINHII